MKIGIVGSSLKENERRLPIYPEHIEWIEPEIRKRLAFEVNYGENFGYSDRYFSKLSFSMLSRKELFNNCDMLILLKPTLEDLDQMNTHQTLCGWVHCVQQKSITQLAIEKRLTLIAWETMHQWNSAGEKIMHIFYKNNEIAGYAAVLHVLQLLGLDGFYGPRRKVAIIGYGAVSRGAIYALQGRGFNNIHVYSRRPAHLIDNQNPDVYYKNIYIEKNGQIMIKENDRRISPLIDDLSKADIICNCILQDTDNPLIFINEHQLVFIKPHAIIIDISCDEGMGFSFAKPTSFDNPIFTVGDNIIYYSVDHIPSYLWNAATREISRTLIPYLQDIAGGPAIWKRNETIRRAIEIQNGLIINDKILTFQKRDQQYPHQFIKTNPC